VAPWRGAETAPRRSGCSRACRGASLPTSPRSESTAGRRGTWRGRVVRVARRRWVPNEHREGQASGLRRRAPTPVPPATEAPCATTTASAAERATDECGDAGRDVECRAVRLLITVVRRCSGRRHPEPRCVRAAGGRSDPRAREAWTALPVRNLEGSCPGPRCASRPPRDAPGLPWDTSRSADRGAVPTWMQNRSAPDASGRQRSCR
jgi:hypothetical protein